MSQNKVLEIINLTKVYGKRFAVNNTSFSIKAGEIMGFLGPNGAGKTTTIKMITGLTKITSGTVNICGFSIVNDFKKAIDKVGAIVEGPDMYDYMSGFENLKLFANISTKKISNKKIHDIAHVVGIDDRLSDKVKTYSLGMKQRLGIAQALLNDPKLLIFDEPTNGLDPNGIKDIHNLLINLKERYKISILISSHNLKEMQDLCDTITIINQGKIVESQSISEFNSTSNQNSIAITVDYPNYAGKVVMDNINVAVKIEGSDIVFPLDNKEIPKIVSILLSKRVSVFGVTKANKNLEQLYFDIVASNNED